MELAFRCMGNQTLTAEHVQCATDDMSANVPLNHGLDPARTGTAGVSGQAKQVRGDFYQSRRGHINN